MESRERLEDIEVDMEVLDKRLYKDPDLYATSEVRCSYRDLTLRAIMALTEAVLELKEALTPTRIEEVDEDRAAP